MDLHTVSSRRKISYSRNELFKIQRVSHCSLLGWIFADLKRASLQHLRGCRAGRRDFIRRIKVIASNRIDVEGPCYALEHMEGVNKKCSGRKFCSSFFTHISEHFPAYLRLN